MQRLVIFLSIPPLFLISCQLKQVVVSKSQPVTILISPDAADQEKLAAKEVKRCIYLRTGTPLEIQAVSSLPGKGNFILVSHKDRTIIKEIAGISKASSLQNQQFILKTVTDNKRRILTITGGDSIGTLYGAYKFAEHLGVRFYLHGDIVPDEQQKFSLHDVKETGKPLFELRGIHPFHDFPEGPDWWNLDDYKAIFSQLPKLRMNFFGLRT